MIDRLRWLPVRLGVLAITNLGFTGIKPTSSQIVQRMIVESMHAPFNAKVSHIRSSRESGFFYQLLVEAILSPSPALLSRDFRHPIIASFTFSKAFSRVSPSERQPGRSGHSATYLPSSFFSMIMLNFMIVVTCLKSYKLSGCWF